MNRILTLIVVSFACFEVSGQNIKAYLQINNSLFFMGDQVKGIVMFESKVPNGKILKIEAADKDDSTFYSEYYIIEDQKAHFNFQLPYQMKQGVAKIIVSTSNSKRRIYLFNQHINVSALNKKLSELADIQELPILHKSNSAIAYRRLDDNLIKTEYPDNLKVLNISISDSLHGMIWQSTSIEANSINKWVDKIFIDGRLIKSGGPIYTRLLGLYCNQEDQFYFSGSDSLGYFTFLINGYNDWKSFQLFPFDKSAEDAIYQPLLVPDSEIIDDLPTNPEYIQAYDNAQIRFAAYSHFGYDWPITQVKYNTTPAETLKPDRIYQISNYKKFDKLNQFCSENNLDLTFSEGKALLFIPSQYSKDFAVFKNAPLFIINGIATKNSLAISNLATNDVIKMEMYYDLNKLKKKYEVFSREGVIKIQTGGTVPVLSDIEQKNVIKQAGLNYPIAANPLPIYVPDLLTQRYWKGKNMVSPTISWPKSEKFMSLWITYQDLNDGTINIAKAIPVK